MSKFNFIDSIKNNNIVSKFEDHIATIFNNIINLNNEKALINFDKLGIFPIIVHIDNDKVDIIHHIHLGCTNIVTKINTNSKCIAGLMDKGAPVEFNDINNESFLKGKVTKFESI